MKQADPTEDVYRMMDEAGLVTGKLLATREPMAKLVINIRTELARKLKEYIEDRDSRGQKHIEVKTEEDDGSRI